MIVRNKKTEKEYVISLEHFEKMKEQGIADKFRIIDRSDFVPEKKTIPIPEDIGVILSANKSKKKNKL